MLPASGHIQAATAPGYTTALAWGNNRFGRIETGTVSFALAGARNAER